MLGKNQIFGNRNISFKEIKKFNLDGYKEVNAAVDEVKKVIDPLSEGNDIYASVVNDKLILHKNTGNTAGHVNGNIKELSIPLNKCSAGKILREVARILDLDW